MVIKSLVDNCRVSVIPSQFELLKQSIDALSLRHKVVSQNLANLNTPGYRAKEVIFEEELGKRLRSGRNQSLNEPLVRVDADRSARFDGNTVDLDLEVSALEKNAMLYETYTELLSSKISMMRSAITGR